MMQCGAPAIAACCIRCRSALRRHMQRTAFSGASLWSCFASLPAWDVCFASSAPGITLLLTFRANPLDHEADGVRQETLWQRYLRHTYVVQAEGSLASLTVEVPVLVVVCMMVITGTQLVAKCAAAVLYAVYQVVLKEERERAEDGASLGVGHPLLHFLERERALAALQLAIDKQPHGGGLHAHLLHPLF